MNTSRVYLIRSASNVARDLLAQLVSGIVLEWDRIGRFRAPDGARSATSVTQNGSFPATFTVIVHRLAAADPIGWGAPVISLCSDIYTDPTFGYSAWTI
jgi:hypothetical protein